MSAGAKMKDDAGMDEAASMDAQNAAVIMQQARERAQRELAVRRPALFVTWGLAVLASYGTLWLSVRGQHPFHGPTVPAVVTLVALFLVAAIITVRFVDRASSGVGGPSVLQRGIFVSALAAGVLAMDIFIHAVARAGGGGIVLMAAIEPLLRRA